ncbi:MAG: ATP-binding cassette domain-containing protein [Rhodobacterales bacterium]|nr:ATP-binding cassette domain-containing protein [Rhodobacterales bacterium]
MRIQTRQLTRVFGAVQAVDHLDLQIEQAGVVGLLGPNGAGKTTTMKMLTGELPMTSGRALVCGYDVLEQPLQVKSRVGYLPEKPPIYPALRVGEFLRFAADLRGVPIGRVASRVGEVMEQVGLTGWERRNLGGLSKGYRQRVGLAQAILHLPELLILDEPTSGLDPAQQAQIRALIASLGERRLVLLSTHKLVEVSHLCERVLLMNHGQLVGDGTVQTLAEEAGAHGWVELRVLGDEDLSAQLSACSEVESVRRLASGRYRLTGSPLLVSAIAEMSTANHWSLQALAPHATSLDDVFRALVAP